MMFRESKLLKELFLKEKKLSTLIIVSSVVSSFASSIGLTLLMPVLFSAFKISIGTESFTSKILEKMGSYLPIAGALAPLLIVLSILIFKNILSFVRLRLYGELSKNNLLYLRQELLSHYLKKDITFFQKNGSGPLFNHLTLGVEKASRAMLDTIDFIGMVFQLFTYLIVLICISKLLLLFCALFSLPLFAVVKKISNSAKSLSQEQNLQQNSISQEISNTLQSIRIVKLGARESDHSKWIYEKGLEMQNKVKKLLFLSGITFPVAELMGIFMLFSLLAITLKYNLNIEAHSFLSFLLILSRVLPLTNIITQRRVEIASNFGALIELESNLVDYKDIRSQNGEKKWSKLNNSIRFENVSFRYPGSELMTLNAISLEIKKGDHVAIAGPSGSGKSTLIDLILKFYSVDSGEIRIDATSINNIQTSELRQKIALVPQESILMFSTVKDNLCYFNPKASEIDIWRALDQADLADFISRLPEGLNTKLGERGLNLSGGQRQRLCIARALLMNPEILIFDEATSSLDSISEAKIVDSIKKASAGRTTITIAHRLGTILHCNKVFMIEHGWLTESGDLNTLLKSSTRFKKFAETQNMLKTG